MKLIYELSELANSDINQIWIYTFSKWSEKQADKYYTELFKEIQKLCRNPTLGKPLNEIPGEFRIWPKDSHLIVYSVEASTLKISRVLHKRMDIENRLIE